MQRQLEFYEEYRRQQDSKKLEQKLIARHRWLKKKAKSGLVGPSLDTIEEAVLLEKQEEKACGDDTMQTDVAQSHCAECNQSQLAALISNISTQDLTKLNHNFISLTQSHVECDDINCFFRPAELPDSDQEEMDGIQNTERWAWRGQVVFAAES